MVVCPATFSVGLVMLAEPMLNPPGLTFAVVWHPEPLQSRVPIGMWLAEVVVIVTFAKVFATLAPWQIRQEVTPWCVPVTE
jgi:dipeptide/tripeptide permease